MFNLINSVFVHGWNNQTDMSVLANTALVVLFDLQPTQQWSNTPRDDKAFLPQYTWYGKISDNIVLYCPPLLVLNGAPFLTDNLN